MLAQNNAKATNGRRILLCRMRETVLSGAKTKWAEHELRGIDSALRQLESEQWDACPRCGKRFHV